MLIELAVALSVGTLLLLCINPIAGVAALFIAKPLIDATWGHRVLFDLPLTQIISGLVPLVILPRLLFGGAEQSLRTMPLRWIWLLYASYLTVAAMTIVYNEGVQSGLNIWLRHINGLVGFFMIQAFFHEGHKLKQLLVALIVAGLFPIGVGLYQLITGTVWGGDEQQVEGIIRNVGLYHDAITVRHYAFQTILALFLYGALVARTHLAVRAGLLLYMAMATVVMAKAYSKAGLLILALWAASWMILQRRLVPLMVLVGTVTAFSMFAASDYLQQVLAIFQKELGFLAGNVAADRTFNGRWYIWHGMFLEWEKLGWAAQMFGSGKIALGAHNDFFLILFHGGVIGLVLYLSLLVTVGWKIARNVVRQADAFAVAALMVFLSWMVDTVGLVPSAYSGYQWFVWGIIGLSFRMRAEEQESLRVASEISVSDVTNEWGNGDILDTAPAVTGRQYPLVSG
jgi:hypothetical protein